MLKLVATFRRPAEPQEWMNRFLTVHEPLCHRLPGLRRIELSSPFDALPLPGGGSGDRRGTPFLVCELYFDDRRSFDQAMTSPEGQEMLRDLEEFAQGDVQLYLADVERDHAPG